MLNSIFWYLVLCAALATVIGISRVLKAAFKPFVDGYKHAEMYRKQMAAKN